MAGLTLSEALPKKTDSQAQRQQASSIYQRLVHAEDNQRNGLPMCPTLLTDSFSTKGPFAGSPLATQAASSQPPAMGPTLKKFPKPHISVPLSGIEVVGLAS